MEKMPSMGSGRSHSSPSKLRRSDSGGGAGRLCAVLVAVSLVVFTLSVREGGTGFISGTRNVAQTVVSPLRLLGSAITGPFLGLGNVVRNLTADEQTLSELKAENERLVARNVELEEAEVTAKRLQELLDLRSTYNLQSTAARVIAGSTDSWTATVTIDRGTSAGIAVGMPVADECGAVGQVISCTPTTSTVRLLSDESSSVSAMVQASRAQGMVEGSIDGTLHLAFIRTDQTVNVGDIVVTSGLGGVFPKGLPLGKVSSIESAPGSTYYDIIVEPYTKPGSLEEVLVITSLTNEQQATAEDIELADAKDLDAASGRRVSDDGEDGGVEEGGQAQETDEGEEESGNEEGDGPVVAKVTGAGSVENAGDGLGGASSEDEGSTQVINTNAYSSEGVDDYAGQGQA